MVTNRLRRFLGQGLGLCDQAFAWLIQVVAWASVIGVPLNVASFNACLIAEASVSRCVVRLGIEPSIDV